MLYFEDAETLERSFVDAYNGQRAKFPPGYTYADLIAWFFERGWIAPATRKSGGWIVEVPDEAQLDSDLICDLVCDLAGPEPSLDEMYCR